MRGDQPMDEVDLLAGPELPRAGAELRRRRRSPATSTWPRPPSGAAGSTSSLGRQPAGLPGPLAAAQERAGVARRAALAVAAEQPPRGGRAWALAVLVANLSGVQHAFWVVLGTLSVLRSNALSTGRTCSRPARHGGRLRRRRRAGRARRHQHDAAVAAPAACGPARRPRARRDLLRRRPGRVHAHAPDPLQHPRARGLADRPGAHRGRRARQRRQPRGRPAVLAARRAAPRSARRWPRRTPTARTTSPAPCGSAWGAATPRARSVPAPTDEAMPRGRRRTPARRHVPQLPRRARRQAPPARRGHQPRHRRRRPAPRRRRRTRPLAAATTSAGGDRTAARSEPARDHRTDDRLVRATSPPPSPARTTYPSRSAHDELATSGSSPPSATTCAAKTARPPPPPCE